MGRYSEQKKLAAAEEYCRGCFGIREVARRHGVNFASLRLWAAAYRVHGARGVQRKAREFYSAEFKLEVLRRMSAEMLSQRQAAALFNVRRHDMIGAWQRAYEIGGVAALSPHSRSRLKPMVKRGQSETESEKFDDKTRTRKQLLEELNRLRMENAYLKKLKALAQPDEPARDRGPKSCKS